MLLSINVSVYNMTSRDKLKMQHQLKIPGNAQLGPLFKPHLFANRFWRLAAIRKLIHLSFAFASQRPPPKGHLEDLLAFVHMSMSLGICDKPLEFMDVSIDDPFWWSVFCRQCKSALHLFNPFVYDLIFQSRKSTDLNSRMVPPSLNLLNQFCATHSLTVSGTSWKTLPLPFGCLNGL